MKVLIISPVHDIPTTISYQAVYRLTKWLREHQIEYTLLPFILANRLSLSLLNLEKYSGTFFYGHGEEDRLGDWFIKLIPIISTKNIDKFKGQIIYTMACLSGQELARIAIEKGVRAYFGHNIRYFAFINHLTQNYNYIDDWIELVNFIPKQLVLGTSCSEALRKYEHFANTLYAKYLHIEKDVNLELLFSNAYHLNLFGDGTAQLK